MNYSGRSLTDRLAPKNFKNLECPSHQSPNSRIKKPKLPPRTQGDDRLCIRCVCWSEKFCGSTITLWLATVPRFTKLLKSVVDCTVVIDYSFYRNQCTHKHNYTVSSLSIKELKKRESLKLLFFKFKFDSIFVPFFSFDWAKISLPNCAPSTPLQYSEFKSFPRCSTIRQWNSSHPIRNSSSNIHRHLSSVAFA